MAERSFRRWMGRALLAIGSTLIALVCAELGLRIFDVAPLRFGHPWHIEADDKRSGLDLYPDDPRDYFPIDLSDEATRAAWSARGLAEVEERWRLTPHAVPFVYTEELCRGEERPPPDEGQSRVVVIGDSFTEGQGVMQEHTYAAVLDARIEEAQVLGCGRRGYDFPRLHEWFDEKLAALAPDVVVYGMILNDPQQSDAFRARQTFLDDWILDRRRMFTDGDGSPPAWPPRIVQLVEERIEQRSVAEATTLWYRDMVGDANREGWEATLDHIEAMHRTMRARGGALLVVLWPLLVNLDGAYPFASVHETIGQALRARGIIFHDALTAFEGEDPASLWVHPADRHPNERAHALFADQVEPLLRRALPSGDVGPTAHRPGRD